MSLTLSLSLSLSLFLFLFPPLPRIFSLDPPLSRACLTRSVSLSSRRRRRYSSWSRPLPSFSMALLLSWSRPSSALVLPFLLEAFCPFCKCVCVCVCLGMDSNLCQCHGAASVAILAAVYYWTTVSLCLYRVKSLMIKKLDNGLIHCVPPQKLWCVCVCLYFVILIHYQSILRS